MTHKVNNFWTVKYSGDDRKFRCWHSDDYNNIWQQFVHNVHKNNSTLRITIHYNYYINHYTQWQWPQILQLQIVFKINNKKLETICDENRRSYEVKIPTTAFWPMKNGMFAYTNDRPAPWYEERKPHAADAVIWELHGLYEGHDIRGMQFSSNNYIVIGYKDLLWEPCRVMNWINIQMFRTCYFGQQVTFKVEIKSRVGLLNKNYQKSHTTELQVQRIVVTFLKTTISVVPKFATNRCKHNANYCCENKT